jgi:hypothetical protein
VSFSARTAKHFEGPDYAAVSGKIVCDLPRDGARVWVRSTKRSGWAFGANDVIEGNATVRIHWHYDGCVLDVDMDDGTEMSIHPEFGGDIVPLPDDTPVDLIRLVAAGYRRSLVRSTANV